MCVERKNLITKFDLIWSDMDLTSANCQMEYVITSNEHHYQCKMAQKACVARLPVTFIFQWPIVTDLFTSFPSRLHNS